MDPLHRSVMHLIIAFSIHQNDNFPYFSFLTSRFYSYKHPHYCQSWGSLCTVLDLCHFWSWFSKIKIWAHFKVYLSYFWAFWAIIRQLKLCKIVKQIKILNFEVISKSQNYSHETILWTKNWNDQHCKDHFGGHFLGLKPGLIRASMEKKGRLIMIIKARLDQPELRKEIRTKINDICKEMSILYMHNSSSVTNSDSLSLFQSQEMSNYEKPAEA